MIEATVYVIALLIIGVTSAISVFYPKYDDNLIQRVGLSVTCMGATLRLLDMVDIVDSNNNARFLLTYGVAIFCLGAVYKFWRKT